MQIDPTVGVLVESLGFKLLVVLLFEETLHDALFTTACVRQDPKLAVHVFLLLETIDAFVSHALKHFVRQVHFASS
jgi:hypothetical protein